MLREWSFSGKARHQRPDSRHALQLERFENCMQYLVGRMMTHLNAGRRRSIERTLSQWVRVHESGVFMIC